MEQAVDQAGEGTEELAEEVPQVIVYGSCCYLKWAKGVDGS